MNLETALTIGVPIAASVIGAWLKKNPFTSVGRRSKALMEMEFISSFLSFDITHRPKMIVEQAFAIHFGYRYDYDQITAVLKFLNPYRAIRLLEDTQDFLELTVKGEFIYKGRYTSDIYRKADAFWHYFAYMVSILPSIFALMFLMDIVRDFDYSNIISFIIIEISLVMFAFGQVSKAAGIQHAEQFMIEQQKSRNTHVVI